MIRKISNTQKHTAEEYRAEKVLFVIITDGQENSSREFTAARIKTEVEQRKEKDGWEFIFLGANMNAIETAASYGITANRAVDYLADSAGTRTNFDVMEEAICTFRKDGEIRESCFDRIRKDVRERGSRS